MERYQERELEILTAIGEGQPLTQRALAQRLGVALGLTNLYLKRLAKKGYIKIVEFPRKPAARKRLRYLLTPKGIAEKTRLTYEHVTYSLNLYRRARQTLREFLGLLPASGIKRIALQDLTLESDSLWIAPDIQAELDWAQILQSKHGSISEPLNLRYRPAYLLELKTAPGRFLAYENVYCSDLGLWAHDNRYVVYDNGKETLWWLYTPGSSTPITENSRTCP